MSHAVTGIKLVVCLALFSAGPAFTQSPSDEATPEGNAAAPVAHVYVQTAPGVEVYAASATGVLTRVKGSPFPILGQMEGINGKYLVAVGTTNLRTYAIESNGGVGRQVGIINTANHQGGECGPTNGWWTVLDHAGKYFYVSLWTQATFPGCAAIQSYQINSNGSFTFLGSNYDEIPDGDGWEFGGSIQTVSSNDKFIYGTHEQGSDVFEALTLVDGVAVPISNNNDIFPAQVPNFDPYVPKGMTTDNAGHLAVQLVAGDDTFTPSLVQIGIFTIQPDGSLTTTNLASQMPNDPVTAIPTIMSSSWDGKYLGLAGENGLFIMQYHGAGPLTPISGPLSNIQIDQVQWDTKENLYGLSYTTGQIFVFHVGETITQAKGSPFNGLPAYGRRGLIVVPKI